MSFGRNVSRQGPIVLLFACLAMAQTPDTGMIQGRVVDQSGGGIAGVGIHVRHGQTGLERSTQTDSAGRFSLAGLPIGGSYEIAAAREGFDTGRVPDLALAAGGTASVTIVLSIAASQTQVIVTGAAGEVETAQPQIGLRIESSQAAGMPLLDRKITYLPLLNSANRPALNQGDVFMNENLFTTNGAGRRQTWFEVDGATDNDSWGRQTTFTTLPLLSVEEMVVLSNAFSVEYGGSTGSVVDIVTKSGGSRFHGEALELWRPAATAAALSGFSSTNATSGNELTSDTLGQSAAALSGPLGDATYFSAAGEFSRETRASPVTSPVAPGIFDGHYRQWLGHFRADRRLNGHHDLFLRADLDGYYDTNPNGTVGGNTLPSVDRIFRRRTYSTELGETATLGPALVNNLRIQFQLASPITEFDPVIYGTQYQVPISAGGTFTTGTSQSALLLNRQYQLNDVLSAARGAHQLSFGADIIFAHNGGDSKEFGGPIYLGEFVYKACTQPLAVCESAAYLGNITNVASYTQSFGNANYTVNDALWSVFAQDNWRLRRDLTVNLGVR